jgi:translation initiation factor IF-3
MGKWRTPVAAPNKQKINEQIRASQVRVIAGDGEQLGVITTEEAMTRAQQDNLDLVEVAPDEKPPVCRIMDYGKYKYQQKKRQNKGHTHQTKIKEIRVRPKTGVHDITVKVNKAREFLGQKDKVIVTVIFRGREMAHIEEGRRVLNGVVAQLEDVAKIEAAPRQNGRRMACTLAPK